MQRLPSRGIEFEEGEGEADFGHSGEQNVYFHQGDFAAEL